MLKKKKAPGVYVMAIFQGAMIGIIGFLIMGYMFTFFDETANQPQMVSLPASGETEASTPDKEVEKVVTKTFYTMQYGVFSTEEAAKQYLGDLQLPAAQLVQLDNYLFIWDGFSAQAETLVKSPTAQSFTKQLNITASDCEKPQELLVANLDQLENQNLILEQINAAKLSNDEMKLFQKWLTMIDPSPAKSLTALNSILSSQACVKIELK